MKESIRFVYLKCYSCYYGDRNEWVMSYGKYWNGGFIERRCPRCGFLDTRNSLELPYDDVIS